MIVINSYSKFEQLINIPPFSLMVEHVAIEVVVTTKCRFDSCTGYFLCFHHENFKLFEYLF